MENNEMIEFIAEPLTEKLKLSVTYFHLGYE